MNTPRVIVLALSAWLLGGSGAQAQCVQVALLNDSGQVIIPDGLVTGLKVAGTPIFNVPLPPHREQREVRPIPCPEDLQREVTQLYNRSCTSERARQQAVESNGTTLDIVMQQCAALSQALQAAR